MTELPDDVEQLKAMLLKLQEENSALKKTVDTQAEEVVELENKMQLLLEQLNLSKSNASRPKAKKSPKALSTKPSSRMHYQTSSQAS
ncbi:hypothetical protein [Vibrio celticus]|uniref:hypothetical protein n=1 Tax=Vibrio celticus TaxID=446372 RepID=UPI0021C2EC15|nr:hypothetical protein [Vibrio celticus]